MFALHGQLLLTTITMICLLVADTLVPKDIYYPTKKFLKNSYTKSSVCVFYSTFLFSMLELLGMHLLIGRGEKMSGLTRKILDFC